MANDNLMQLIKDENNSQLREVLKNEIKLKEIHISVYSESPLISSTKPFMLLLSTIEKNAVASSDNDRIVLTKNDGYKTKFVNVLFSEIAECYYQTLCNRFELVLNIQNIWYRATVFN